jgi:hypothetical protein
MEASKALAKWDVEASMILPDGRRRTTHAIARPERRPDGSVLWTGVILDASRAKEAEDNLKAANRERKSMSHRSLAEMEMEDFARYTAWFNERGGSTRGELAARLKAAGKLPDGSGGDKYLDSAREIEADQSLCNWWRLQPDTPCPLEQILETLTIVHDEMTPETLLQSYWRASGDLGCTEVSLGTDTPRQAFARVVASRGDKLRKVREKATPLAADFYLPLT